MSQQVGSMVWSTAEPAREMGPRAEPAPHSRAQAKIVFAPDGTILSANASYLRLMGYAAKDIIGQSHDMLLSPAERESASYRRFWADLRDGECKTALIKRHTSDGREIWLQAIYNPLLDRAGATIRITKFCTDITAYRMEAANSSSQIQAINRSHAVIEFTLDGTILTANENYLRIMGYTLEEIVGERHTMFVDAAKRNSPGQHAFWAALAAGEFRDGEFMRIARDGREVWLRASYNPIFDLNAKPYKIVAFASDVSAQVMIREQFREANADLARMARHYARAKNNAEEASRAKTRFLAGMSHELRTPLNGILGYAQLLHMDGGLTSAADNAHSGDDGCRQPSAGNDKLRARSQRIESGDTGLRAGTTDIVALAEASLAIVRAAAQKKGLELCLQLAPDVPRRVTADTAKIRQILLNLLGNAVKYTNKGGVELRVAIVASVATPPSFTIGEPKLRFSVADSGPGIPLERRFRLFEDFERLGAATSTATEGAGLGLSLSKRLATVMGGTLAYQDNPTGGSLFVLEIPLLEAKAAPPLGQVAVKEPPKGKNARILVVDDVAMNRDIAAAFLSSAGYQVVCAESGEKGLEEAASGDFLAILMDVRMPEMDGLEATRRIRALGGSRSAVPVVALTAQVFTEQVAACRAAGMDTHVGKPFTLENLLGAITRVVEERLNGAPVPMPDRTDMKAPAAPVLPVLDQMTLERTAVLLNASSMRSFLETLTLRAQELRRNLAARSHSGTVDQPLAEAAHRIAGSAGMFGFDRLAHVAKQFEEAVNNHSPEAEDLAEDLDSVLNASLLALRDIDLTVVQAPQAVG